MALNNILNDNFSNLKNITIYSDDQIKKLMEKPCRQNSFEELLLKEIQYTQANEEDTLLNLVAELIPCVYGPQDLCGPLPPRKG